MARIAILLLLLIAAATAAVWWAERADDPAASPAAPDTVPHRPGPTLAPGAQAEADGARDSVPEPVSARLAEKVARLRALEAGFEAGHVAVTEVAAAKRDVWLARAEAGEVSESEAWSAIAKLDAQALALTEELLRFGFCTPADVGRARLQVQFSLWKAGDPEERFEEERAAYLHAIERDHAARVAAAVSAPREIHRLVLDACREFPLGAGARDFAFERAGTRLRDALLADLRPLQDAGQWGERRVALELEVLELRLLIADVDAHDAHARMATLYEHVVRDLEQRTTGVPPAPSDLAAARLRVHRERFILGESREYAPLRESHVQEQTEWLDARYRSMLMTTKERAAALERLEAEFPPPEELPVLDRDD